MNEQSQTQQTDSFCLSRRHFMLLAGGTAVTLAVGTASGLGQDVQATKKEYPKKVLFDVSAITPGKPMKFQYPDELQTFSNCMLVKLGVPAGGGVGPDKDIVAFSTLCTHMGGPLDGTYLHEHQVLGPCPLHQTTYDLTHHGMVVSGHATVSLPQVQLAIEKGKVVATGMIGLIYGRHSNL